MKKKVSFNDAQNQTFVRGAPTMCTSELYLQDNKLLLHR